MLTKSKQETQGGEVERTFMLELPWPPVTGNRAVRHVRTGVHYKTADARRYEAEVARTLAEQGLGSIGRQEPLIGPLKALWVLSPPDRRSRDMDNLRKTTADALTLAGFWRDDSNKVLVRETFEWTDPSPGGAILLTVEVLA